MRQFRAHPVIAAAVARGELSDAWAVKIADWTRKLPPDWRDDVDKLLVDTAAAGANLEDLAIVAQAAYEKWRQQQGPDPDDGDDGYDDRYLKLATTIDGVGRVNGNLTGECAAAVQAVLEALGKKASPDDDRTEAQRYHDALQEACELLLAARLVPDRAGAATRADVIIALSQLPLHARRPRKSSTPTSPPLAGEHAYLTGAGARAAACDAITSPVVTGHPDLTVVDKMIAIVLAYLDTTGSEPAGGHGDPDADEDASPAGTATPPGTATRARAGTGRAGTAAAPPTGPRRCPPRRGRHCGTPSPGSPSTWPPAPPASPPSCAAACSTSRSTASPSSSTSASPAPSRRTSAAPSSCAPRAAANGPAAPSAPSTATSITCATSSTAARHPCRIVSFCASSTTTPASTAAAGGSSCTPTPPPPPTGQTGRSSTATGHQATSRPAASRQAASEKSATGHPVRDHPTANRHITGATTAAHADPATWEQPLPGRGCRPARTRRERSPARRQ